MDMYLAKLKEKPIPNVDVKSGLSFSFSTNVKEIFPKDREPWDEEVEEDEEEKRDEGDETKENKQLENQKEEPCIIIDQRSTLHFSAKHY